MAKQNDMKRATMRDVARQAGVSVATVSRVLNSPEQVAQETRRHVQRAVDQLRFRPSAAARAINSGRTKIVGALVPTLDNAIFARYLDGLEKSLGEAGLSLIVSATKDDPEIQTAKAKELLNIGVEGLVVSGVHHSSAFMHLVEREQLPVVAISYYQPSFSFPTVGYDNGAAAVLALEHLVGLGHRNLAVVHGPRFHNDRTRTRISALKEAAKGVTLTFFEEEIGVQEGGRAARLALASGQDFTGFMCLSDVMAMGVMFELQSQGMRVPQDVSVIGMEGLPLTAHLAPPLTTIDLSVHQMGLEAGQALAVWVNSRSRPNSVLLPMFLVERNSTSHPSGQKPQE